MRTSYFPSKSLLYPLQWLVLLSAVFVTVIAYGESISDQLPVRPLSTQQPTSKSQAVKELPSAVPKPVQSKPRLAPEVKQPAADKLNITIRRLGKQVQLQTSEPVRGVDLYTGEKRITRLRGGKDKTVFDLTPYLNKIPDGRLTVRVYDNRGGRIVQNLDVRAYQQAAGPVVVTPPKTQTRMLTDSPMKARGQPDLARPAVKLHRPPEPVAASFAHGIRVIAPVRGQVHVPGGSITVELQLESRLPSTAAQKTSYRISLLRRSSERSATLMHSGVVADLPRGGRLPPWQLPTFVVPGTDYYVRVEAGELSGESADFSIGMATVQNPLRVLSPNAGEIWGQRTAHEIEWSGAADAVVELWREGSFIAVLSDQQVSEYDARSRTFRMPWFIPRDLESGSGYRIRVSRRGSATYDESDEDFNIRPERAGDRNILVQAEQRFVNGGAYLAVTTLCDEALCGSGFTSKFSITSRDAGYARSMESRRAPHSCSMRGFPLEFIGLDPPVPEAYDYVVNMQYGSCFGYSEPITLGDPEYDGGERELRNHDISSPDSHSEWLPETRHRISWTDGGREQATLENRRFTLMYNREEVFDISAGSLSCEHKTCFADWDLPADLLNHAYAQDLFQIRISSEGATGTSDNFRIPRRGLHLESPTEGATYYVLNYLPTSWTEIGNLNFDSVNLELYSLSDTYPIMLATDLPVTSNHLSHYIGPAVPPGDYWVRLSDPSRVISTGAAWHVAASEQFHIAYPSLDLIYPGVVDLVVSDGDSMTVTWRAENFAVRAGRGGGYVGGTLTLLMPDGHGGPLTICDRLDLSSGTFTWKVGYAHCPRQPDDWFTAGPPENVGWLSERSYSGSGYRLRLSVNALPNVLDESEAFTIR